MEAKKFSMLFKVECLQEKQGKRLTNILDQVFNHKQLKILTSKQILQRLPIALAQIKAGNNISEDLKLYIFFPSSKINY